MGLHHSHRDHMHQMPHGSHAAGHNHEAMGSDPNKLQVVFYVFNVFNNLSSALSANAVLWSIAERLKYEIPSNNEAIALRSWPENFNASLVLSLVWT